MPLEHFRHDNVTVNTTDTSAKSKGTGRKLAGWACVVAITVLATHLADKAFTAHATGTGAAARQAPKNLPAWGELVTYDFQFEQPKEYLGFVQTDNLETVWHFGGLTLVKQVHDLLLEAGLTEAEAAEALSTDRVTVTARGIDLRPTGELVLGLSPAVREKLYARLAPQTENAYINAPCFIPDGDVATFFEGSGVATETLALIKKLLYTHGVYHYFSDVELVMNHIPTAEGRFALIKALSRQDAVMARLRIRPDTDIDKLVAYWGEAPGVRTKDLRPLMESQQRLPDGGAISLLYVLPPFARERLYTSPLPPTAGGAPSDCHWTTLNFFREVPDNRFSDAAFASGYVESNYYQIASPGLYGDLVLVVSREGRVIHSAVYLADDIVFTKNGANVAQPWVLMRMKNLLGVYCTLANTDEPRLLVCRAKSR